jgi:hypothetical protein
LTLLGVVAIDGFVALMASDLYVRSGRTVFIAPASLVFTLPSIAILLAAFAWPMVRYRRDLASALKATEPKPVKRVDPFYAVRVLGLAKASAFTSSAIMGWQIGVLIYLLSRPAQVSGAIARTIEAGIGALVLLVVALIVERFCRLPNEAQGLPLEATKVSGQTSAEPGATA